MDINDLKTDNYGCLTTFILLALILLESLGIMFLWNWLMPVLFGLTTITYMQAVGIQCLSWLLFGHNSNIKQND